MTMSGPEQERIRVAAVYAAMSDEELGQIAGSGDELSAAAQGALQAEATKRGLTLSFAPPRGEDVFEFNETVTLRQFRDLLATEQQSGDTKNYEKLGKAYRSHTGLLLSNAIVRFLAGWAQLWRITSYHEPTAAHARMRAPGTG